MNEKSSAVKRTSMQLSIAKIVKDYIYRIDLDADYQRERVWSNKEQELLLDSIVKGIDIPKLYLAEVKDNKQFTYECIDGKQRLLTLWHFLDPDEDPDHSVRIEFLNQKYTYSELKKEHPSIANTIENYMLDFVVYDEAHLTDSFVREIFRRLQLGIRLNSGEILNSQLGTIRDFVFKEIGKDGPFVRHTKLSDKRYSRQFTVSQICINSFHRHRHGEFVRARLRDIEEFFGEESSLNKKDENLARITKVLKLMDGAFKEKAEYISSRAVAVSAYLFVESLYTKGKTSLLPQFVKFYVKLLEAIESDMELISKFEKPENRTVLDEFQKYVLQASVEPYSIKRRDEFIRKAFAYFRNSATKGRILGS